MRPVLRVGAVPGRRCATERRTPPPDHGDGVDESTDALVDRACFLRRYEPDQVPRVCGLATLSAQRRAPRRRIRLDPERTTVAGYRPSGRGRTPPVTRRPGSAPVAR